MSKDRRNNLLLLAIPFLATFVVYFLTVCRTVYSGDSGEFSLDIPTLGIAHPPGYPLLLFLGKVFLTIIPGNVAYLLNIFSALLASLAAAVGAFVARNLIFPVGKRDDLQAIIISILAAVIWGYSNALWAAAVGIEVYSLGACLFLLSLYSLLKYYEIHQQRYLLFSIYIFCLGLTDHLTIAALAIPILYTLIKEKAPLRVWILSIFFFIITISAYLYIPLRSAHNPIADWDHPVRLSTVIEHITARRYRPFISGFWIGNYFENLRRSIQIAANQLPLWLGVPGLAVVLLARRLKGSVKFIIFAVIVFNFLSVAVYDIPDIDQYYLPSFFLGTVGLAILINWIAGKLLSKGRQIAVVATMALIVISTLAVNYSRNDQAHNRLTYTYGMDILNSVPRNSLLISIGDNANSALYYLHYIEEIRSDLEIYDPVKTYGMIKDRLGIKRSDKSRLGDELCLKMLYDNHEKAYLVKEHMLTGRTPIDYKELKLTPVGMVYRPGDWPLQSGIWNQLEIPRLEELADKLDFKGITMLANLHLCRGEDRLAQADTAGARSEFEQAARVGGLSGEAMAHNSLGVFFRRIGQTDLAEREYDLALNSWHLTAFERANIYVNLGNLKKDGGNFDQAIEFYNKALGINRENREAKYDLNLTNAYLNLNRGRFKEAAGDFENALTYSGADPRIIFNLGVIYDQKLDDRERAIYNYRRFAEIAPNAPEGQAALRRIGELSGQK